MKFKGTTGKGVQVRIVDEDGFDDRFHKLFIYW